MTINHSNCDHPSTSSARSKCRRAHANGHEVAQGASVKTVNFARGGAKKASTPRDRDKQCDICGVERIVMRGTPPVEGYMIFVGEKCAYYLNDALDIVHLD